MDSTVDSINQRTISPVKLFWFKYMITQGDARKIGNKRLLRVAVFTFLLIEIESKTDFLAHLTCLMTH